MKGIGKLLGYIVLGFNFILAGFLLLSAYSPYINPECHPVLSNAGLAFPVFLLGNVLFLVFWLFIYWRYALLSFLTLLACSCQIRTYFPLNFKTAEIPAGTFKLLSYNVMAFDEDKKHTEEKPNPILKYLQQSDADIICLQEFILGTDKHHLRKADVDKALKSYPFRTYHQVGGERTNGLACYSRFPILSAKPLKYDSQYNGSMIYTLDIQGDTVTLINNHLESNKLTYADKAVYESMIKDPNANKISNGTKLLLSKLAEASEIRSRQARKIAEVIKECTTPYIIVCGDFNDTPISYTHRVITRDLKDAFTQSGHGLGISYNQNKFYFRIDNILISKNLQSYNCTVDSSIKDSDHYPIWCYIGKKE